MIPGAVHRSHEENPGKLQLGECPMKTVRPVIAWDGFPYLQMRSIGSHNMSGSEKEGKDCPIIIIDKGDKEMIPGVYTDLLRKIQKNLR